MYLSNFEYLHPFWRYPLPTFEVIQNRAKFCMFLALQKFFQLLWVGAAEILDLHYKALSSTDHRAQFHVDRPTHLGDLALNIKNCSHTQTA